MTAPGNVAAAVGKIEAALVWKGDDARRLQTGLGNSARVAMAIRGNLQLTHRPNCHSLLE